MCIPFVDTECGIGDALGDAASGIAGGWINDLAKEFAGTATKMVEIAIAGWLSPELGASPSTINFLTDSTSFYVAAIAVFSLMIAAGKMVLERNAKAAKDAARGMIVLVLVSFAGVPTLLALQEVADAYAPWIVEQGTNDQLGERLNLVLGNLARFIPVVGAIAVMAIAFLLIVASLIQMLLAIAMSALMVLLAGLLPLAAAASISSGGRSILAKYTSWLAAALLYKPVAATIYAAGFFMLGSDDESMWTILQGLVMMVLAIVALPAIVRLVAPMSASVGGGGGGVAAAGVAAMGAVASGAIQLGSSKGGGGGGPSGGKTPNGGAPVAPAGAQQSGLPSGGGAKPPGGGVAPSASAGGGAAMAGPGGAGAATGGGAAMAGAGAAGAATGGVATAAMVVGQAGAQVGRAGMQAAQGTATAATGADER